LAREMRNQPISHRLDKGRYSAKKMQKIGNPEPGTKVVMYQTTDTQNKPVFGMAVCDTVFNPKSINIPVLTTQVAVAYVINVLKECPTEISAMERLVSDYKKEKTLPSGSIANAT